MSLVVNTNIASMNAQRSLHASGRELSTAMERLSTGKKINSAADDAAGFAIAESMTAQIRGLSMAAKNANDAQSLLSVVENATNDVTDILQRVRELAVQAQSDTNSDTDKASERQLFAAPLAAFRESKLGSKVVTRCGDVGSSSSMIGSSWLTPFSRSFLETFFRSLRL